MKKLSALIALLLCVTVGGVYANWVYTNDEVDIQDRKYEAVATLTDKQLTTEHGTFTIVSDLVVKIDQNNSVEGDHSAKLVFLTTTGGEDPTLTVTFEPNINAPQDVKDHGVQAELYLGETSTMKYYSDADGHLTTAGAPGALERSVFVLSNTASDSFEGDPSVPENAGKAVVWQKEGTVFKAVYDKTDFAQMIQLTTIQNTQDEPVTFILDTQADYTTFSENVLTGNIAFHVTDGTVNGAGGQG